LVIKIVGKDHLNKEGNEVCGLVCSTNSCIVMF
jgi:hypothetical protein